ncbi:MAG: hypothetical protein LBD25_01995 [Coriobacteriales bacterium]|jgi:hypothetical protein|nr:hypothetical protein [Coriobacteriales bacterium]
MTKITYYIDSSIRVEYNGRVARFRGELYCDGFEANASSMEWILPDGTRETPTEEERLEVMEAAATYSKGTRNCVIFEDDEGNELLFDVQISADRRAKRKGLWRRLFG